MTDTEQYIRTQAKTLEPLLAPKSVALIGASRKEGSIGNAIFNNLVSSDFQGVLYPINPHAKHIHGFEAYKSIKDIGKPVDLAIIAVPAKFVFDVVKECAECGVRGLTIISAGFAEVSDNARSTQNEIADFARAHGMRLVGPNCMGLLNTDKNVRLNGTFSPISPPTGNVGMLSQSGALGVLILDYAHKLNIGISSFVSIGNKADVSGNDLISFWAEDDNTKVMALYLESFGNPQRFARLAPRIGREKPIVAVKSGRTAAGARAASSHSAALASQDRAVGALFQQAGIIRTDTLEEMFDIIALLSTQPLPTGPRVAVLTNAGGPAILLTDALTSLGLEVQPLSKDTQAKLKEFLPDEAAVTNPVDMIAAAGPKEYLRALEVLGNDPDVDVLACLYVPPLVSNPEEVGHAIAQGSGTIPSDKPIVTVFMSSLGAPEILASGPRGSIPSFSFPENAARAISKAWRYAKWRGRLQGSYFHFTESEASTIQAAVQEYAQRATDGWLSSDDCQSLLGHIGIDVPRTSYAAFEELEKIADQIGYPVVLKGISSQVLHKTDFGAVALNLRSYDEVKKAAETMRKRFAEHGFEVEQFMVQRHIGPGIEVFVGVTADKTFGHLVLCGMGGIQAELIKDTCIRLSPLTDLDAAEMIDSTRLKKLMDGFRGTPEGDRDSLVYALQRISALVEIVPEILEIDINPLRVFPEGQSALALDCRIRLDASMS